MSAIQWSGGKLHGASEAKVQGFLHDTKDTRLTHGHSNPDIDLSRTPDNMSYRGLTYQQKCDRYDELMETVKIKRKSSGANANVTLQKLVMCIPEEMQDGDKYDAAQVRSWLNNVGAILEREFGELLIDIDCHVDEVHQYLDPRKDKDDPDRIVWSRIHLHAAVVPAVWEVVKDKAGNPILDSDGNQVKELVLNAHKFAKKATIVRLNKLVQEMTQQKFGMTFMTGAGKGMKHQSVEDLKRLSAQAMRDEGIRDAVMPLVEALNAVDDAIAGATANYLTALGVTIERHYVCNPQNDGNVLPFVKMGKLTARDYAQRVRLCVDEQMASTSIVRTWHHTSAGWLVTNEANSVTGGEYCYSFRVPA